MKSLARLLALVGLVLAPELANAQHATGSYLAFTPTTVGGGCTASATQVCQWYDSVSGQLKLRTVAGDTPASPAYETIEVGGVAIAPSRLVLNFVSGVTCVDNPGAGRTDCTVSGGGGGAAGLSPAYNGGTVAADQTMLIGAGHGGAGIFKASAPATGDLLLVEDSSGNKIVDIADNATIHLLAATADTPGLNVAYNFDTITDLGGGGGTALWRFNNAGHKIFLIEGIYGAAQLTWFDTNPAALAILGTMSFETTSPFGQINTWGPDGAFTQLQIDTTTLITNSSARLVSINNQGNDRLYIGASGDLFLPATGTIFGVPNIAVSSHLLLDANTARLVASNAVVDASNASGTLIQYTPLTLGVEFISDGWDFFDSRNGDVLILDNTGATTTYALAPGLTGATNVQLGKPARPFSAAFVPLIFGGDPAAGFGAIGFSVGEADFYANSAGNPVFFIINGELGPYVANTTLGSLSREWAGLFNSGPLSCGYNSQAGASYTIVASDCYVGLSNAAARAITLIAASLFAPGQIVEFKDEAGTAAGANITITRAGADTIDGATTFVIATNSGAAILRSDGVSKWFVDASR